MEASLLACLGLLCIVAVSALSPRVGIAAPLTLVVAGALLALLPGVPEIELEPEWILAGVLPPLLYASAVNMPVMDFRRDLKAINGLSVVLVVGSALACGLLFSWIVPGVDLAAGVALGAVVSPTDAVATQIVSRTGVPGRITTVLEGESMINDATALVLLRSAVAAVGVGVSVGGVLLDFAQAVLVAIAVGSVVAFVVLFVRARLHDATLNTAVSFAVPFLAYVPAEHLGGSGLVAAVVTGLCTGYWGPRVLRALDRRAEQVNWRTVAFVLEGAIFLAMGLELWPLLDRFTEDGGEFADVLWPVLAGFAVLLAARALYVPFLLVGLRQDRLRMSASKGRLDGFRDFLANDDSGRLSQRRVERLHVRIERRVADIEFYDTARLGPRDGAVMVWAGMRGGITLAAAQSLPEDFPQRALLVIVAFCIATGSLLLQGGTLPWVARRLGLAGGSPLADEAELTDLGELLDEVAADRLGELPDEDPEVIEHARAESHLDKAVRWAGPDGPDRRRKVAAFVRVRSDVLAAQREALLDARATGRFSSAALDEMLFRLDRGELAVGALDARQRE